MSEEIPGTSKKEGTESEEDNPFEFMTKAITRFWTKN